MLVEAGATLDVALAAMVDRCFATSVAPPSTLLVGVMPGAVVVDAQPVSEDGTRFGVVVSPKIVAGGRLGSAFAACSYLPLVHSLTILELRVCPLMSSMYSSRWSMGPLLSSEKRMMSLLVPAMTPELTRSALMPCSPALHNLSG